MASTIDRSVSRRRFMQFLAGSPLLAAGSGSAFAQPFLPKPQQADPKGPQAGDGTQGLGVLCLQIFCNAPSLLP